MIKYLNETDGFSATTSFLMLLEGSIRHARSTVAALLCLPWPASSAKARLNLYVLQAGVQCVMHSSLMPGSTIAQAPLGVSMHTSLLDACSMMKAGVGTIHRKTAQRFSAAAAPA